MCIRDRARRNKAMKEKKEKKEAIAMGITMTISILLVIAIFMLVPFLLAELLNGKIDSFVARNAIEGAIRLVIFILYIKAISLMKDIRRDVYKRQPKDLLSTDVT